MTPVKLYSEVLRLLFLLSLLRHQEEDVEEAEEDDAAASAEDRRIAVLALDQCPERETGQEADRDEAVQHREPPGPVRGVGEVHHEGVGGEVEGWTTPGQILKALHQQPLDLSVVRNHHTKWIYCTYF